MLPAPRPVLLCPSHLPQCPGWGSPREQNSLQRTPRENWRDGGASVSAQGKGSSRPLEAGRAEGFCWRASSPSMAVPKDIWGPSAVSRTPLGLAAGPPLRACLLYPFPFPTSSFPGAQLPMPMVGVCLSYLCLTLPLPQGPHLVCISCPRWVPCPEVWAGALCGKPCFRRGPVPSLSQELCALSSKEVTQPRGPSAPGNITEYQAIFSVPGGADVFMHFLNATFFPASGCVLFSRTVCSDHPLLSWVDLLGVSLVPCDPIICHLCARLPADGGSSTWGATHQPCIPVASCGARPPPSVRPSLGACLY